MQKSIVPGTMAPCQSQALVSRSHLLGTINAHRLVVETSVWTKVVNQSNRLIANSKSYSASVAEI